VGKLSRRPVAIALGMIAATGGLLSFAAADPITSAFKQGMQRISKVFSPSSTPEPANDAVSLSNNAKAGPDLYLAMARMYEQSGKLDMAEKQYKQGLKAAPKHLGLQLGYARLKDRQGLSEEAIQLYQQVARQYPQEAAVHNDLGLCYARRGVLNEAVGELERAIQLQPRKVLYRNNIATVLVEMGRIDPALMHLRAVHQESVAYYNLGYLLQKKGQAKAAEDCFARALEKDPSLTAAKIWLEKLRDTPVSGPQVVRPMDQAIMPPPAAVRPSPMTGPTPPVFGDPLAEPPLSDPGMDASVAVPLPPAGPFQVRPEEARPPLPSPKHARSPAPRPVALPPVEDAPLPPRVSQPVQPLLGSPYPGPAPQEPPGPPELPPQPAVKPLPPVEDAPLPP
jgi:Tfp pilus assembly protein PilF